MQKADIAKHIHQQAGISDAEAAKLLDWIIELLKTTLQAGEPITIYGFGKFTVRNKRARQGRNPRTGEAVTISARRVVTFHPSVLFRREMNGVPAERHDAVARPSKEGAAAEGEVIGKTDQSIPEFT